MLTLTTKEEQYQEGCKQSPSGKRQCSISAGGNISLLPLKRKNLWPYAHIVSAPFKKGAVDFGNACVQASGIWLKSPPSVRRSVAGVCSCYFHKHARAGLCPPPDPRSWLSPSSWAQIRSFLLNPALIFKHKVIPPELSEMPQDSVSQDGRLCGKFWVFLVFKSLLKY